MIGQQDSSYDDLPARVPPDALEAPEPPDAARLFRRSRFFRFSKRKHDSEGNNRVPPVMICWRRSVRSELISWNYGARGLPGICVLGGLDPLASLLPTFFVRPIDNFHALDLVSDALEVVMTNATIGQKVICNGFNGVITKVCDGQLSGMVEVRLARGTVCVPYSYPDCYPNESPSATLRNAVRHIRRVHMSRAWTLDAGDETAIALLESRIYELDYADAPGMLRLIIHSEPEFDRINHGPFEHPVSEPSDELPGGPYFYHYEPTTGREVTVTIRLAGEFAVKLTNTDNAKSVVKVFPSSARNEAIAHAKSFVGL